MHDTPNNSRLFIAIDLPEGLQESIARRSYDVRELRWSPPEQLHLTLAFIGKLPVDKMIALDDALSRIEFAPFELQFDRVGSFGNRTLWLGCGPSDPILALHEQIKDSLYQIEVAIETRPFRPHVTLARAKTPMTSTQIDQLEAALLPTPLAMTVDQFALKNSVLTTTSPLHQIIRLYGNHKIAAS